MPETHLDPHGQPLTAPKPPSLTHHRSLQPQSNAHSSICWSQNCAAKKGHLRDVKNANKTASQVQKKEQEERGATEETVWWLKFDFRAVSEEMRAIIQQENGKDERLKQKQMEKERLKGGRLVQRGGVEVWRKEPRFRGSGRVSVLDDAIRDGKEIAFSEEVLPSDWWRESKKWEARADEESEEDTSMDDIIQEVSAFTLRTVPLRTRKKTGKKVVKKRVSFKTPLVEEIPYLQPPELVHSDSASDCGLSVGSDSGCEYDALLDFSEDEAQGWVPVMVREDHDEEEGWVSLTGSWMMLGGAQESKKMVRM